MVEKQNDHAVEHNNYIPESAVPAAGHDAQEPRSSQMPNGHSVGEQSHGAEGNMPEKRDSRSRFPARRTGTAGSLTNRSSAGSGVLGIGAKTSLEGERPVGVQLSDKPYDD